MSGLAKMLGLGSRQVDAILREREAQAEVAAAAAERRSAPVRYHRIKLQPHAGFQRWLSAGIEKTRDHYGVAPSATASRILAQQPHPAATTTTTATVKPVTYKTVRRIRGAIRIDMGNTQIAHTPGGDLAITKMVRNRARTAVMPSTRAPMPTVHQLEQRSEAYRHNGGIVKSRKKPTYRSSIVSQPAALPNIWDTRRQSDRFQLPTPPASPTKPTGGGGGNRATTTTAAAPPPYPQASSLHGSKRPTAHTGLAIGCDHNLNRSLQRPTARKDALPPKTAIKRKARELTGAEESMSDDDDDDDSESESDGGSPCQAASHFVLNGRRLPKNDFIM